MCVCVCVLMCISIEKLQLHGLGQIPGIGGRSGVVPGIGGRSDVVKRGNKPACNNIRKTSNMLHVYHTRSV